MSKLFKLKPWLTLSEAAKYSSEMIAEEVQESDILQMALEGHLTLSVNLVNHAQADLGKTVHPSEVPFMDVIIPPILTEHEEISRIFKGKFLSEEEAIVFNERVVSISGIWDMSMRGCERLDVEHRYLWLTGGPELELCDLDGDVLLYRPEDQVWANLKEHMANNPYSKKSDYPLDEHYRDYNNFYPAGGLPDDCVWGLRPSNLMKLIQALTEPAVTNESLATKSINSYLSVIWALSEALVGELTGKANKDAEIILQALDLKGVERPVTSKTLAKYLSDIGK